MKLLVLGGTVFLSRAVAEEGLLRGHEVTCACRGESGTVPTGAIHLAWDRDQPVPAALADGTFDAVVDVARHPSRVRSAVAAFPDAHWVFVSTINVYADDSVPGGTPDTLPLREAVLTDEDPASAPEMYGAMKVGCEQIVAQGAASSAIVRPGLIVGPGDLSGRFSYWPARLADGGDVLAPGAPDEVVQVIDVRDLAGWIVGLAEARTTGVYDGTGRETSRADFLEQVAAGAGSRPTYHWADQEFLATQSVEPWAGPRSLPVWLPLPEYAGLLAHDVSASYRAGLRTRPLTETARDTLAWLRENPEAPVTGLTREEEAEVLAALRSS